MEGSGFTITTGRAGTVMAEETNSSTQLAVNPYKGIDWSSIQQCRANFHAHTTRSDGRMDPPDVIDVYHEAGYSILAITEHDHYTDAITWPWSKWDRDPVELGMLAVQGNEIFQFNDVGSLFNGYSHSPPGLSIEEVKEGLDEITSRHGLALFYHPGRSGEKPAWYADFFSRYSTLLGLEVFNQSDRFSTDRLTWDRVLGLTMPERPVWGFSNDDSHRFEHLFGNYQFMLMEELSENALRRALQGGSFFFCREPGRSGRALAPRVEGVLVNEERCTITIEGAGWNEVEWISEKSEIVGRGDVFSYRHIQSPFVRVRLVGPFGETGSQPFGFVRSRG